MTGTKTISTLAFLFYTEISLMAILRSLFILIILFLFLFLFLSLFPLPIPTGQFLVIKLHPGYPSHLTLHSVVRLMSSKSRDLSLLSLLLLVVNDLLLLPLHPLLDLLDMELLFIHKLLHWSRDMYLTLSFLLPSHSLINSWLTLSSLYLKMKLLLLLLKMLHLNNSTLRQLLKTQVNRLLLLN